MQYVENPPPQYEVNGVQFFLGVALILGGIYVISQYAFEPPGFLGVILIIVGGFVCKLSRKLPPGWKGK